jgi:TPR repeat protein
MANRYLQAAKSGDDDAQFYLGALYSAGVGWPRSDEEAFRWFSRAADQGHSHAMLITSGLYAIGRGVRKDHVRAYEPPPPCPSGRPPRNPEIGPLFRSSRAQ